MGDPLSTDEEEEVQTTIRMSRALYSRIKQFKTSNGFPSISDTIVYVAQKGIKDDISPRESDFLQFTDDVTFAKVGNVIEQFNFVFSYYKREVDSSIELPELKIDASFGEMEEVVGIRMEQSFLSMVRNHADGLTGGSVSKMFRVSMIRGMSLHIEEDGEVDREIFDKHMSVQRNIEDTLRDVRVILERTFVDHRNATIDNMTKNPYQASIFREKYDKFLDTSAQDYLEGMVGEELFLNIEEALDEVNYSDFYNGDNSDEEVSD